MARFYIPYGTQKRILTLPPPWRATSITRQEVNALPNPYKAVEAALDTLTDNTQIETFQNIHTAAIAINDKTRPVPHQYLLPPLLARIETLGVNPKDIKLIIANGTHHPMRPEEFSRILPVEILKRYPIISHNCDTSETHAYLGETQRGTPVWINRHFVSADLRVSIGNIEPHQFMGFSGGAKTVSIGLASRETINTNHAMLSDPQAKACSYAENPLRQDVEEIGKMASIHFVLNTILNTHKEIISVLAGKPIAVMQEAIPIVQKTFEVPIEAPYDLIIAAPGGYPKDINLYQSQKALAHAALAAKEGGSIILAAACTEGIGSQSYENWMNKTFKSHTAVLKEFDQEGFSVGPHKAALIARDAQHLEQLWLVSELPPKTVRKYLLTPGTLKEAISTVLKTLPEDARIGIMPQASTTIPRLEKK